MKLSSRAGKRGQVRGSKLLSLVRAVLRTKDNATFAILRPKDDFNSERSLLPRLALGAALLLAVLPASAKPKVVPIQTAVIENTGSTNTFGYQVTVTATGSAFRFTTASGGATAPTGKPIVVEPRESRFLRSSGMAALGQRAQRFFADLDAAMPLASLPVRHGMRSASFGTQIYITYKGQKSPDLTFASDPRTAALKADIVSLRDTLHIRNDMRHPIVIMKKAPLLNH